MPNKYVRYAEVTVTGKIGVRTRSWNEASNAVSTACVVSNDPMVKNKPFQLEPGKFLPTDAIMQFIKDCDFDYILDISISYYTYKLVEVNENETKE